MNKINLFEIFYADDWCYIYLNGNLFEDASSFRAEEIFDMTVNHQPFRYESYNLNSDSDCYLKDRSFPYNKSQDMMKYVS